MTAIRNSNAPHSEAVADAIPHRPAPGVSVQFSED